MQSTTIIYNIANCQVWSTQVQVTIGVVSANWLLYICIYYFAKFYGGNIYLLMKWTARKTFTVIITHFLFIFYNM